ncbi:hypothetical protein GP486_007724 [Trichoglossum hirsutum]|uniref:Uncharacterized protein n=1 Tax=Trichoglossum hirsutum TaxID=265104 RepID=A0A9P8L4N7_9PEZI|nr:hypothetical protein GP486_007724 [Trichoglossum hirsutum]
MSGATALRIASLIEGALFGILSLVPLSKDYTGDDSQVRIGVALGGYETGGDAPFIAAFNEETNFIGYYDGNEKIKQGSFLDIGIDQHCFFGCKRGQQAAYLQLHANNDAICVAYIGQTWANGMKRGWLGDMGKMCGMPFYYSEINLQIAGGGTHTPYCTWFDRDHSSPTFNVGAIQLHMSSFSQMGDYALPPEETLCRSPATITHYDAGREVPIPNFWNTNAKSKRNLDSSEKTLRPRSSSSFNGTLIASRFPQHNATDLCAARESSGPDFVSFNEGVFCDMTNKIAWPLCGEAITNNCFDWNTHSLVRERSRKREMSYSNVVVWKPGGQ